MIIQISNLPNRDEMFFNVTQEQWAMIEKLITIEAFQEDVIISEIEVIEI